MKMLPDYWQGEGKSFKANFYSIYQDTQEAFGYVASLVSGPWGVFLVLESNFNKECYHVASLSSQERSLLFEQNQLSSEACEKNGLQDQDEALVEESIGPKEQNWDEEHFQGLLKDNLKEAFEYLDRYFWSNSQARTSYLLQLAEACIKRGELYLTNTILKKVYSSKKAKDALLYELACLFLLSNDFNHKLDGIQILGALSPDTEIAREKLFSIAADALEQAQNNPSDNECFLILCEQSLSSSFLTDASKKEPILAKLAVLTSQSQNIANAHRLCKLIFVNQELKQETLEKILVHARNSEDQNAIKKLTAELEFMQKTPLRL